MVSVWASMIIESDVTGEADTAAEVAPEKTETKMEAPECSDKTRVFGMSSVINILVTLTILTVVAIL